MHMPNLSVTLPSLDGIGSGGQISLTITTPLKMAKAYPTFLRSRKSKSVTLLNSEEAARRAGNRTKANSDQYERLRADAQVKSYTEGIEIVLGNFTRLSNDLVEAANILEYGLLSEKQILGPFSEAASSVLSAKKALGSTLSEAERSTFTSLHNRLSEASKSATEVLKRTQANIERSDPLATETKALLHLHSEISSALVSKKVPSTCPRVKAAKAALHTASTARKKHKTVGSN